MIRERETVAVPGLPVLVGSIGLIVLSGYEIVQGARDASASTVVGWSLALVAAILILTGLFVVNPNEGKVLQFFGSYVGTVKRAGLRWANPLYTKKRISLRVRNFESARLKVNDHEGNPIEIAAIVVWRVVETAEAGAHRIGCRRVRMQHVEVQALGPPIAIRAPALAAREWAAAGALVLRRCVHVASGDPDGPRQSRPRTAAWEIDCGDAYDRRRLSA